MKGMVFTEFLAMVEDGYSPDVADDIIDRADLASGGAYTAIGTYDAAEMSALVQALSERVGVPVPDLLKGYGRYLFERFHVLYPGFFGGVTGAFGFLAEIEAIIHSEVRKLYPEAELPRFEITWANEDRLVMVYRSPRHLGDLAEGLIEGALAHFGESARIVRDDVDAEGSLVRFTLIRAGEDP